MKAPFALYRINEGLNALLDRIDDPDSPITLDELTAAISKLENDKVARFQELRNAILNEEAKQSAITAEIARLGDMKKAADSMVDTLKGAALALLKLSGDQRIDFPTGGHIRWQNNSSPTIAVAVPLKELLPEWVDTRTEIIYTLNRKAVLDTQAIGGDLPEEIAVTQGQHIRLK
jgi:Siphovirus Gp157